MRPLAAAMGSLALDVHRSTRLAHAPRTFPGSGSLIALARSCQPARSTFTQHQLGRLVELLRIPILGSLIAHARRNHRLARRQTLHRSPRLALPSRTSTRTARSYYSHITMFGSLGMSAHPWSRLAPWLRTSALSARSVPSAHPPRRLARPFSYIALIGSLPVHALLCARLAPVTRTSPVTARSRTFAPSASTARSRLTHIASVGSLKGYAHQSARLAHFRRAFASVGSLANYAHRRARLAPLPHTSIWPARSLSPHIRGHGSLARHAHL
jgi:hypothetical protein